jgi:hypothetical protein
MKVFKTDLKYLYRGWGKTQVKIIEKSGSSHMESSIAEILMSYQLWLMDKSEGVFDKKY